MDPQLREFVLIPVSANASSYLLSQKDGYPLSDGFPANRTLRHLLSAEFTATHMFAGQENDVAGRGKADFALFPCLYLSA